MSPFLRFVRLHLVEHLKVQSTCSDSAVLVVMARTLGFMNLPSPSATTITTGPFE
jgi:hypothetical protein